MLTWALVLTGVLTLNRARCPEAPTLDPQTPGSSSDLKTSGSNVVVPPISTTDLPALPTSAITSKRPDERSSATSGAAHTAHMVTATPDVRSTVERSTHVTATMKLTTVVEATVNINTPVKASVKPTAVVKATATPRTPVKATPTRTTHVKATAQPTTAVKVKIVATPPSRANKTICYRYVGCFDNFPPFNNAGLDLPLPPDVMNTKFRLYTREHPVDAHILDYKDHSTFTSLAFDHAKPLKFVIHGFAQSQNATWVRPMKDAFLKMGDFNVVTVDWKKGAEIPYYDQAVANVRLLATEMKLVVDILMRGGLKLEDVHSTGHSLGAHASGYLGFLFHGKLGRISGLDPAEPSYENMDALVRLDETDALFVDVTHTNGAPLLLGGAGIMQPSGHVDFYVNGGEKQPGCKGGLSGAISSLFGGKPIGKAVACSHSRSHDLYIESMVSPCPFTAYPCVSYEEFQKGRCLKCGRTGCSQLGYYANEYSARGKMYLKTAGKTPYCGYHYGVHIQTHSSKSTKGKLFVKLSGTWGDSQFIQVTDDETVKAGSDVKEVIVSPAEVGDISSLAFKYVKHNGFWLGKGEDSLSVDNIKIYSGENGYLYMFCYGGAPISDNKEAWARKTNRKSCG